MSAGRRALTCFFSPVVKQVLQEHSTIWTSSLVNQPLVPGLRSSLTAGFRHHLATASVAVAHGGRKVSLMTNLKQLSKFKLSSLVVLTASSGYVMGSGDVIDWRGLLWTSLGTFGAAACANTLNQVYEVANDRLMSRTCNRPLPSGRMNRFQALTFAIAAGAFGLGTLYHQTNGLTTALGAANIVLYAGVYTPLKQISIVNTWVGAVVGAIPPLMGWASASGQLDAGAWVLSGALFFWQLPHFLALAWLCKDDYLRGGFRMISGTDRSGKRTAAAALRNSIYLLPLGAFAYYANVTTQPFAWEAAALGGMLLLPAARFWQQPSQQAARKLFRASLLYLPLAMAGMAIHRQPHTEQAGITLGEMQAALWQQVEGPPQAGLLPLLRSSLEQSAASAARVLGFSHAVIRCPSTVHSDDGGSRRVLPNRAESEAAVPMVGTSGVEGLLLQGGGSGEEEEEESRSGLPATPAVVVIRRQAQRERSVWVTPVQRAGQRTGMWREGLELSDASHNPWL